MEEKKTKAQTNKKAKTVAKNVEVKSVTKTNSKATTPKRKTNSAEIKQTKEANKKDTTKTKTTAKKIKEVNNKVDVVSKTVAKKTNLKQDEKALKENKKEKKSTTKEQEIDNVVNQVDEASEISVVSEETNEKLEDNALIDANIIKKNELETIKNEIKKNKKISKSKEKKQLKYKKIFKNVLIAIVVMLYFLALVLGNQLIGTIEYITDLKLFILAFAIISIIIFEIAYKKDTFSLGIHGIETLLIGVSTVFILDLYNKQNSNLKFVFGGLIVAFTLYYLIKVLVIAVKKEKLK